MREKKDREIERDAQTERERVHNVLVSPSIEVEFMHELLYLDERVNSIRCLKLKSDVCILHSEN